mmetsp:Transcript_5382/g.16030  ORF Transcript_5382/g.16030 Transcript_5382/m.16030 type:complete len:236 (-) Transcript_5382:24-731(-)
MTKVRGFLESSARCKMRPMWSLTWLPLNVKGGLISKQPSSCVQIIFQDAIDSLVDFRTGSRFSDERAGPGHGRRRRALRPARGHRLGAFDLRRGRGRPMGLRERRRAVSCGDGGWARRALSPASLLWPRRGLGPRLEFHVARVDVGVGCCRSRGRRDELRRDSADPHGERVLHLLCVGSVSPRVDGHARPLQGRRPHQRAVPRGSGRGNGPGQVASLWGRRDGAPVSVVCVSHRV